MMDVLDVRATVMKCKKRGTCSVRGTESRRFTA